MKWKRERLKKRKEKKEEINKRKMEWKRESLE